MSGLGSEQQRIADLMSTAWLSFARTGNPNNSMLPQWPKYDAATRAAMVFAPEPRVVNDIHGKERAWFSSLKMTANG
jgi:para-nitrobenzyl esterase